MVRRPRIQVQLSTDATNPPAATNNSAQTQPQPADTAGATRPNVKVSSPVVLEEYGDYQCPPCGQLYPDLKQIEKEYGNQVQIVFHHFPLMKIHKNALLAAHAAEAARNQNKFWEMHDRLYRNQKEWSELDDPRPVFIDYAKQLGPEDRSVQSAISRAIIIDQKISADIQRGTARGRHRHAHRFPRHAPVEVRGDQPRRPAPGHQYPAGAEGGLLSSAVGRPDNLLPSRHLNLLSSSCC